jgi:hypothetical protein
MDPPERVGVLVLRLWVEEGDTLRSRITSTLDIAAPEKRVRTAASADEIVRVVRAFLDELTSA